MTRTSTDDGGGRYAGVSRRRLLTLSGGTAVAALALSACNDDQDTSAKSASAGSPSPSGSPVKAPPASGVLAANVNESLEKIDPDELDAVSATWVRGFYVMAGADQSDPASQTGITKLLAAAARGYGTALTMKFQYHDKPIPAPGSSAMDAALAQVDKVLAAVMGKVDIVEVGNEPFFETRKADRRTPRINAFYEAVARHTLRYRDAHGAKDRTQIYMGALNTLDKPGPEDAQKLRWVKFVQRTPALAGVDIHPHVDSLAAAQKYVDFVLPHLGTGQKFLATEFSLVQLWKQHLQDQVAPAFAQANGITSGTPVWQFIKDAAHTPVDEQKWNQFLLSNTWFKANKNFLTEQMGRFRGTGKLALAGYGITQSQPIPQFNAHSTPWVINSLFLPYVCRTASDGLPGRNQTWSNEFRALQKV